MRQAEVPGLAFSACIAAENWGPGVVGWMTVVVVVPWLVVCWLVVVVTAVASADRLELSA